MVFNPKMRRGLFYVDCQGQGVNDRQLIAIAVVSVAMRRTTEGVL